MCHLVTEEESLEGDRGLQNRRCQSPMLVSNRGLVDGKEPPREQSAGATEEVLLSRRYLDISITAVTETLHTTFFIEKGGSCFRDQTLTYKNNIPILWERSSTAKITEDALRGPHALSAQSGAVPSLSTNQECNCVLSKHCLFVFFLFQRKQKKLKPGGCSAALLHPAASCRQWKLPFWVLVLTVFSPAFHGERKTRQGERVLRQRLERRVSGVLASGSCGR